MIEALGDRALLFLHVPKTGGTSLGGLLGSRFAPATTLALRNTHYVERHRLLADLDQYRFVQGHLPYDIRRCFRATPFTLTVLREPVDRAVSAYSYLRHDSLGRDLISTASSTREAVAELARRNSLADFARADAAALHTGNRQTWMLLQPYTADYWERANAPRPPLSASDIERACEHLHCCDCIGLAEQLTGTVDLLSYALGVDHLGEIAWANRNTERPTVDELDGDTLAVLLECTEADRVLYRYATELFEQRRRAMMRTLLADNARRVNRESGRHGSGPAGAYSSEVRFDGPIPGEGWYAPEHLNGEWFSWTGPDSSSSLHVGSPPQHGDAMLQIDVIHAVVPDQLFGAAVTFNGVRLDVDIAPGAEGHRITAAVPHHLVRTQHAANRVHILVPRTVRPCDTSPGTLDSRQLGLAISRVALTAR